MLAAFWDGRERDERVKLAGSDLIPNGRYALIRDGSVVKTGDVRRLSEHYEPGDVVCVNTETFEAIRAAVEFKPQND